jgi:CO/xanthine dehydrogenase FAD-binding subunit
VMFIRRLPKFEHHAPVTVAAALDLLARLGSHGRLLAGGTDIFPAMKRREQTPAHLISLKEIEGLKGISADDQEIRIGALTTLGEIERSPLVRQHLPILWSAVQVMASPQIRTLATIGGNICSAVPSADTVPPLIALQASVKLLATGSERSVPIENFFTGPKESVLRADEILAEIVVPRPPARSGGVYIKLMRRNAMELALVGVAAQLRLDESLKICEGARIALGAVAPTPIRAPEAEAMLVGREIDETSAVEAGKAAAKICRPRSGSIRASVEYRRSMVEVLTGRAIREAFQSVSR